jgi:hypothetical protein
MQREKDAVKADNAKADNEIAQLTQELAAIKVRHGVRLIQ